MLAMTNMTGSTDNIEMTDMTELAECIMNTFNDLVNICTYMKTQLNCNHISCCH